jgi:hypothetical protein
MKKTEGRKSRDTVPLNDALSLLTMKIFFKCLLLISMFYITGLSSKGIYHLTFSPILTLLMKSVFNTTVCLSDVFSPLIRFA